MLQSQKHLVRASEIKSQLNTLANADSLTPEQTGDVDRLRNELGSVEAQYRAAVTFEDSFNGDDKPEHREFVELEQRASLSSIFEAVMEHRMTSGAEAELQTALGLSANVIPLALLRTRAVTPAPSDVGTNQQPIIPMVFPDSLAAFLGVDMPVVGVGEAVFPVLTAGAVPQTPAENVAINPLDDTGAFSASVLSPARLQTSFLYSREDRARFAGMDAALRENLSMALSDGLDKEIIQGDNGLLTATNLPNNNVSAVTTYALYREQFAFGRVDGKYASTTADLRVVVGSGTYAHMAAQYRGNADNTDALMALSEATSGVRVSAHVPAVSGTKQNAIVRLGMRRDAVAPIWEGVSLIPDEITKAAEGQIRITGVMLHAVKRAARGGILQAARPSTLVAMLRYRQIESLEADGGALRLRGVAVRYGEETGPPRLPFRERIEARAFAPLGDVKLNRQHSRERLLARTGAGLVLTDTPEALLLRGRLAADARS